jgi:hypothetical protein
LDAIIRQTIAIDSVEAYEVSSVNRTSGVIPMGREPSGTGTKRREMFSINATFTYREADAEPDFDSSSGAELVLIWDGDTQSWDDDDLPWDP